MVNENASVERAGTGTNSPEPEFQPGRRRIVIAGALLVPTIVTLHGTPAWAVTDYTQTAYTYGDNAGMCRNPDFEDDPSEPEFTVCEDDQGEDQQHWEVETDGDNQGIKEFGP